MAEPHSSSHPSHAHGSADQPQVANSQAAGGQETLPQGSGRISSLSAQLKGLTAEVGKTPAPEAEKTSESANESPVETGREEDWGIAPAKSGLSWETKIGFAFVFMLVAVFGFVVYKKIEHNRAETGDLLASVEDGSKGKSSKEETVPPTGNPDENVVENTLPPAQPGNPFGEPTPVEAPNQLTPASFDQQSFDPRGNQQVAISPAPPSVDGSASINQFPAGPPDQFSPQPEPTPAEFPAVEQTQPAAVTVLPTAEPSEFSPAAGTANQDQIAQATTPETFAPSEQFPPAESTPVAGKSADEEFGPFPGNPSPAQPEPQPEPVPFPADLDNEQFSAQSEPAPMPPAAGNPFGAIPAAEQTEPAPKAGDPFASNPIAEEPQNSTFEPQPVPAEVTPMPTELAQPNPLPIQQPAPTEITPDPGFENQAQPVPEELPSNSFAQSPIGQGNDSFAEAPTLVPSGQETGIYVVRPGDNYWKISKKQYGTVRYFSALARFNQSRIPDAKKMRPGMKVMTPPRETLEAQNPDLFPKFAANGAGVSNVGHRTNEKSGFYMDAQGKPMYRVGKGDTLGGIAQKHLGRFSRWVEIYQLNRHRLQNPNALTLGDVLQLPADASRVSMVRQASGVR